MILCRALRKLGLRPVGGNHRVFRRYVDDVWRIPTDHFDRDRARLTGLSRIRVRPIELEAVLVEGSSYCRRTLKKRLYEAGLKTRRCELCGQDELWHGRRMSLILDHINGIPDDNRIENLRIVCPNCAATLDTHCGRKKLGSTTLDRVAGRSRNMYAKWHGYWESYPPSHASGKKAGQNRCRHTNIMITIR